MKTTGQLVGENLYRMRESRGETQAEIAAFINKKVRVKWSQARVSQLESGTIKNVSVNCIIILSRAFDVPLAYWFEGPNDLVCLSVGTSPRTWSTFIQGMLKGHTHTEMWQGCFNKKEQG